MRLSYPWDDKSIRVSQSIKAQLWGDLYKNNPECLKYKTEIPDSKVLSMIGDAYTLIEMKKWAIIACNSIKTLQTFVEVMPLVYSFTSHMYSYLTDTENLIAIISGQKKDDGSELRESMTGMEKLRLYPFLLWDNILAGHRWGEKYSGGVANIFQERVRRKSIFITTYLYGNEFSNETLSRFFNSMAQLWGDTVRNIIYEMSEILAYKIKEENKCPCVSREL